MMRVMKAVTSVWILALLIVLVDCDHAAAADERISEAGATKRHPNEPEGFAPIIEEEWDSFAKYKWWHRPTNEGTTKIETLLYIGTPGNVDGWVKAWLDGVLVIDCRNLKFVNERAEPVLTTIHFAPVWSGTGDTVPATQTLTVERSYVSVKEVDLRTATSAGDNVDAETPTAAGSAAPTEGHSSSPGTTASSVDRLWPNMTRLKGAVIELDEGFEAIELGAPREPNGREWTYQKEAWFDSGDVSVVEDPEAPASPSKVLRYRFSEGRAGGGSPARAVNRGSKPYKHRYIGLSVKWSVPWDEHRVLDKILYWGEQDRIAAGQNPGQFFVFRQAGLIRVNLQFAQNYDGQPHRRDAHRMMPQPAAGEKRLAATRVDDGKWHLIEIICNRSTDGKPDGRLRVWVDDVLQFDFNNVRFNPARDALFRGLDLDPVWGGIGDQKQQTDYLYFDHLLMAGSDEDQE